MSTVNDPLIRLQQHAGLPVPGEEIPTNTLAESIFQIRRGGPSSKIRDITNEIIDCLEAMNRALQQCDESDNQHRGLPRSLVYAESGIVWSCLDASIELRRGDQRSRTAQELLAAAWRIQCAWDALVAGDVESLREAVAAEERARIGSGGDL